MTEDDPRAAAIALYLLLNQNAMIYRQLAPTPAQAQALLAGTSLAEPVADAGLLARLRAWPQGRQVAGSYRQWQQALHWLRQPGHGLWLESVDAPPAAFLAEGAAAPPLLFLSGAHDCLTAPQVALVGSRSATPYGLAVARELAQGLAAQGLAVTSGLASGIDAAAHEGALQAGGLTLAVLGNGIDSCYPPGNRHLQSRIVGEGGLLVSEFAPGTSPRRHHFPRRNAVISALSLGVVVIEAGPGSGSLITAAAAADRHRPVMAVPGAVHSRPSAGCHQLIRDELATLVTSTEDVLMSVAGPLLAWYAKAPLPTLDLSKTDCGLTAVSAADEPILMAMGWETVTVDMVLQRLSTWSPGQVLASLGRLELAGHVCVHAGCYTRVPA